MIKAAILPTDKDFGVVKLLLIISQFYWQVMACKDKISPDLIVMTQDRTNVPRYFPLPAPYLSGINGQPMLSFDSHWDPFENLSRRQRMAGIYDTQLSGK
jgi:hypothetical protein